MKNLSTTNSNLPKTEAPTIYQKNKIYKWTDDDICTQCNLCSESFSFFMRKHHCRSCGRIFCHKCSSYYIKIPEDYGMLQIKSNTTNNYFGWLPQSTSSNSLSNLTNVAEEQQRVCRKCYEDIINYLNINRKMKVLNMLPLDITVLLKMRSVCTLWKKFADIKLNKFRELQFVLPNHKFSSLEKDLLWTNYYYVVHHNKYFVQLLKSINYHTYSERESKLKSVLNYINKVSKDNKHKLSCRIMMCDGNCKSNTAGNNICGLNCDDAINLLTQNISHMAIRNYAIGQFNSVPYNELIFYLPFLVFAMRYETIENSVVGTWLINKCKNKRRAVDKVKFCNEVFWEFQVNLQYGPQKEIKNMYQYFSDKLTHEVSSHITQLITENQRTVNFFVGLKGLDEQAVRSKISALKTSNLRLPINPHINYVISDLNSVHIKSSATMPLTLPLHYVDEEMNVQKFNIMFKFEEIRKDQIVMSLINIIQKILIDEKIDIPIVNYRVRPTGLDHGFIELVPNSHTIHFVKQTKKSTILNFIMDNNPLNTVDQIRNRFLRSCAVFSTCSYLISIGDRHLDNIMVTEKGDLFHIDFSHILGSDPKLTEVKMRISTDMIDTIGGFNSKYYAEFKILCTQIFNAIRKHINLFINMLMMLSVTHADTISESKIYNEIINKFMPGESVEQAEIQLYSVIENSSKNYHYAFVDFFHYYGNPKNTIKTQTKSVMDSLYGMFK